MEKRSLKEAYGMMYGLGDLAYKYFTMQCVYDVVLHLQCITGVFCGHCDEDERIVKSNDLI